MSIVNKPSCRELVQAGTAGLMKTTTQKIVQYTHIMYPTQCEKFHVHLWKSSAEIFCVCSPVIWSTSKENSKPYVKETRVVFHLCVTLNDYTAYQDGCIDSVCWCEFYCMSKTEHTYAFDQLIFTLNNVFTCVNSCHCPSNSSSQTLSLAPIYRRGNQDASYIIYPSSDT